MGESEWDFYGLKNNKNQGKNKHKEKEKKKKNLNSKYDIDTGNDSAPTAPMFPNNEQRQKKW